MSLFSETMTKAIGDYRFLLRRNLSQADRMHKLYELKLRDEEIYNNECDLYEVGHAIAVDIEKNMASSKEGYYSYSGIQEFCKYLKEFLSHYYVENNQVIHRAQKASRALIHSIQLTALPRERLNETVSQQLSKNNITIAEFGSQEQCGLQLQTLTKFQSQNPGFYTSLIAQMESLIAGRQSKAA